MRERWRVCLGGFVCLDAWPRAPLSPPPLGGYFSRKASSRMTPAFAYFDDSWALSRPGFLEAEASALPRERRGFEAPAPAESQCK